MGEARCSPMISNDVFFWYTDILDMIGFRSPLQVPLIVVRSWHPTHGCYRYLRHIDRYLILHIWIVSEVPNVQKLLHTNLSHPFPCMFPLFPMIWGLGSGDWTSLALRLAEPTWHRGSAGATIGISCDGGQEGGPKGFKGLNGGWIWLTQPWEAQIVLLIVSF